MKYALFFFLLFLCLPTARAQDQAAFRTWVDGPLRTALLTEGVAPLTLDRILPMLAYDESVIELDRKQPEHQITLAKYLQNTLPDSRVETGRELLARHAPLLTDVEARFGVPAELIVALWGMESSFGDNRGDEDVFNALATLAFEGRRAAFFQKELLEALRIVDEGRDPNQLRGSWAGAMGQCQFMPSTYRRFAVDHDGDGVRDIWENEGDIFASMANYLVAEGWKTGQSWGKEVMVTRHIASSKLGLTKSASLAEWSRAGVRDLSGRKLTAAQPHAYLIQPDGVGGRSFLVYDNFLALMKWNRSTYFGVAVGLFMDRLKSLNVAESQ